MKLLLVRHLWGVVGSHEELFPRFKAQGYGAIETPLPAIEERARFQELLSEHNLAYIPQILTAGKSVKEHLASFRQGVEQAKALSPLKINCHSGKDTWNIDEAVQFYEQALAIEADAGIAVAHETHRSRVFFYPTITHHLLDRFPRLNICCDLSHWVCVCERLLDDQLETIQECARHCIHIHARVGYEEGPQVPDPRAPEYQHYLEAHERWWQTIWDAQEERGMQVTTLTPEFGPPGYLHTLPYTQAPVANLDDICNWQAQRQVENFARRSHKAQPPSRATGA